MTLSEFRGMVRLLVPGAKAPRIDDPTLDILINMGVNDVNIHALAYQGNKKFNVSEDTYEYALHTYISDFACMDKSGLWWNEGSASATAWRKLDAMTRRVLDDQFPKWKDDESDTPLRYVIESDNLIVHPTPDTNLDDGFWVFYIKKAVSMTDGTHYPFTGSTTEIPAFQVLDDAIIDYVRWKLAAPLGKTEIGIVAEKDYYRNLRDRILLLNRRPDILASPANRMRGPIIGR